MSNKIPNKNETMYLQLNTLVVGGFNFIMYNIMNQTVKTKIPQLFQLSEH